MPAVYPWVACNHASGRPGRSGRKSVPDLVGEFARFENFVREDYGEGVYG